MITKFGEGLTDWGRTVLPESDERGEGVVYPDVTGYATVASFQGTGACEPADPVSPTRRLRFPSDPVPRAVHPALFKSKGRRSMTPEQARNIFGGIHRQMGAMQDLAMAMEKDLNGELSDEELVSVVETYLASANNLESLRNTRGVIG